MSGETTTQDGGKGTEPVLGAPAVKNGADGTQTPAPTTTVSATGTESKVGEKPADKAPEQAAAEKKAADDAAAKKATDDKAAAEKKAADDKAAADKQWAEFKPKRAEGITSDEAQLKPVLVALREAGLSTEQAQKIFELNDKLASEGLKARQESINKHFAEERAAFVAKSKADKEYGGKLEAATEVAEKAFKRFIDADTLKDMRALNFDAHPGFLKAFWKIGLLLKDDTIAGADGAGRKPTDQEVLDNMFPSMAKR